MIFFSVPGFAYDATQPIVTDKRIRTLIYNENDVFKIVTHYGYQSNIEFGPKEKIMTISIGDQSAWQIIPAERHLFIRALAEHAHTNMTVITNERIYQFDLYAYPKDEEGHDDLAYVIRFYYPQEHEVGIPMSQPGPIDMTLPAPPTRATQPAYNFNYSLSGPNDIAPIKVFDDGNQTYFQFGSFQHNPQIYLVDNQGYEQPVSGQIQGNYIIINQRGAKFSIRANDKVVCVFNEQMQSGF